MAFRHDFPKPYEFIWFCNGPDQKQSLLTDFTIEHMRNCHMGLREIEGITQHALRPYNLTRALAAQNLQIAHQVIRPEILNEQIT